MENLQHILDRFLGFLQSLPDTIGDLWKWIGENAAALGALFAFLTLLVSLPRIKRRLEGKSKQPDPALPGADRDRQAMLAKIRAHWVKPWLESDLYQHARVELKLTEREGAVQTRIHRYNQTSGGTGLEIPRDKPIEQIFDDASGQLLILGEPGTGKSTKLIELAKALLDRARGRYLQTNPSDPQPFFLGEKAGRAGRMDPV